MGQSSVFIVETFGAIKVLEDEKGALAPVVSAKQRKGQIEQLAKKFSVSAKRNIDEIITRIQCKLDCIKASYEKEGFKFN